MTRAPSLIVTVLALALTLVALPGAASAWDQTRRLYLLAGGAGQLIALDLDHVEAMGPMKRVRQITIFAKLRFNGPWQYAFADSLMELDCASGRGRQVSTTFRTATYTALGDAESHDPWSDFTPGTVGGATLALVCRGEGYQPKNMVTASPVTLRASLVKAGRN